MAFKLYGDPTNNNLENLQLLCSEFHFATYGYCGTGPQESALIEACFEKIGFSFDVRCGGYLLNFFLKV